MPVAANRCKSIAVLVTVDFRDPANTYSIQFTLVTVIFHLSGGLTVFRCRSPPPLSIDVTERRPQPHHGLLKRRQQTSLPGGTGNSYQPATAAHVATTPATQAQANELAGDRGAEPAVDVSLAHLRLPLILEGLKRFVDFGPTRLILMREGNKGRGRGEVGNGGRKEKTGGGKYVL